ncbi:MAG: hypothetical protein KJI72_01445 [Patescibacteria group bacterium]|nr:hypothetical protein [Patescibacteria group bacterium]
MGYNSARGQIALPFILLISGIIIEITIAGSFVTYFLGTAGLGERLSLRASAAAHSGIRDAMIKITRDKEFGSTPQNYNLTVGDDNTSVSAMRTVDNALNIYIYTISSTATAGSRQRKLVAILVVNQTTGYVQLQSLSEEPVT